MEAIVIFSFKFVVNNPIENLCDLNSVFEKATAVQQTCNEMITLTPFLT